MLSLIPKLVDFSLFVSTDHLKKRRAGDLSHKLVVSWIDSSIRIYTLETTWLDFFSFESHRLFGLSRDSKPIVQNQTSKQLPQIVILLHQSIQLPFLSPLTDRYFDNWRVDIISCNRRYGTIFNIFPRSSSTFLLSCHQILILNNPRLCYYHLLHQSM